LVCHLTALSKQVNYLETAFDICRRYRQRPKRFIGLAAGATLGDGLVEWMGRLEAARETVEDTRKSLELDGASLSLTASTQQNNL
jgi:hypothetical protein